MNKELVLTRTKRIRKASYVLLFKNKRVTRNLILLTLLISIINQPLLRGESEMVNCNGQGLVCNNQVNAAIDAGCRGFISIDGLLEAPCFGAGVQYSLEVKVDKNKTYTEVVNAGSSGSLGQGISISPEYITCDKTYTIKVVRSVSGGSRNTCSTRVKFEDHTPPSIRPINQTIVACEGISDEALLEQIHFSVVDFCPSTTNKVSLGHFPVNFCNGNATVPVTVEAVDFCGNVAKEYFNVRVTRPSPSQLVLPKDTILTCGSGSDPTIAGYPSLDVDGDGVGDIPIIETTCSFATSYTDSQFPGCASGQKVFRTWKIFDWCSSTSSFNTYQQVIQVKDTEAPELTCPKNKEIGTKDNPKLVIATSYDCSAQINNLLPAAKDNCDGEISTIIYKISDRNNASSTYNVSSTELNEGKYFIEYAAKDACGNLSARCKYYFNVQPGGIPVALCKDQLNVSLNGSYATIRAQDIDAGSYDDCSSISLSIKKTGGDWSSSINFTCEESANNTKVYLRAVNRAGKSNTCWISIKAAYGGTPCTSSSAQEEEKEEEVEEEEKETEEITPVPTTDENVPSYDVTITSPLKGKIKTIDNKPVPQVAIEAKNNFGFEQIGLSDEEGNFTISLPQNADYQLHFEKESTMSNGVSIIDMVIILRHILGITEFQTPHQHIAADINNSGKITTLDVVELRKLILGIGSADIPSWRFVKAEVVDDSSINLTLEVEGAFINLTAIKVGDLNNTASPDGLVSSEVRSNRVSNIHTQNQWVQKGDLITVPFSLTKLKDLYGVQLALHTSSMKILSVQSEVLQEQQWEFLTDRELAIAWDYLSGKDKVQDRFFDLTLRAEKSGFIKDFLKISSNRIEPMAYNSEEETSTISLKFEESTITKNTQLTSYPNPFSDETTISFNLDQAEEVSLVLRDVNGALLNQFEIQGQKGINTINLSQEDVITTGMIFYYLQTKSTTILNKMIKTP